MEFKYMSELLVAEDKELLISIGIVAHNEADCIGKMLSSLFKQSLLNQTISRLHIELIVLPNGCTDDTAEVAHQTLNSLVDPSTNKSIHWKVREIEQPGKPNAWNLFVHKFSRPNAQYFFLMDSDIQFLDENTLYSMLQTILSSSDAWVVVDKPIKDVSLKPNKTLRESLSSVISGLSGGKATEGGPAWLCGQLYCAKSDVLKQISFPTGLMNDDSFLYTMIVTENLKTKQNPNRVILAKSASHVFEAYTEISHLLRHERWLIAGSAVNELVFNRLRELDKVGQTAGEYILKNNDSYPQWLSVLVQDEAKKRQWLIPRFILIRRFIGLSNKPFYKKVILSPIALAAFIVDFILSVQANQSLRQSSGLGYWGKHSQIL
ncbi:MAG: glycosyltransferase [Cyanobacteria bacterium P01_G01_bin.49]